MLSRKVLIAEDEPAILSMLCELLKSAGYQVIPVYDGEEALRLTAKELPSLALLDINMPKLDGLEVCLRLKKNPATASIPIIMLTATSEPNAVEKAISYGALTYITKPSSSEEILKAVASAIV